MERGRIMQGTRWRRGVRLKKKTLVCIALGAMILAGATLRAEWPFFTLSEVKEGQRGVGYTVVLGTEIRSFSVEVIGLVQNNARDRHFILIRVSGGVLHGSRGIAAGMSGSPVFISGRLAGAIGYAFDRADPSYGLVTPIEDMLRLWERQYETGSIALAPSPLLPPGCTRAIPVDTPLLISAGRIPAELESLGKRFGLRIVTAAPAFGAAARTTPPLQPGSAVAVAFALGDYSAVAIGTVTWLDGNRFLAFGHPVANHGDVDYPATGAYIYRVIDSIEMPFKIGVPLNQIGRFVQDRGAGASGIINEAADTVAIRAVVHDRGTGLRRTYDSVVVREPALFRALCRSAFLDAIDQTLDEYAPGSARVVLRIEADGLSQPLVRRNFFYHDKDIADAALAEVGEAIDLLYQNDFQEIRLRSVQLEVSLAPTPLLARVIRARVDREQVRPGEQVKVEVELKPFRLPSLVVPFTVTLPADLEPGSTVDLIVRGGYESVQEEQQSKDGFFGLVQSAQPATLAEYLAAFTDRPRNNELILEYLPFPGKGQGANSSGSKPIVLVQGCDYVVSGQTHLELKVLGEPADVEPQ